MTPLTHTILHIMRSRITCIILRYLYKIHTTLRYLQKPFKAEKDHYKPYEGMDK